MCRRRLAERGVGESEEGRSSGGERARTVRAERQRLRGARLLRAKPLLFSFFTAFSSRALTAKTRLSPPFHRRGAWNATRIARRRGRKRRCKGRSEYKRRRNLSSPSNACSPPPPQSSSEGDAVATRVLLSSFIVAKQRRNDDTQPQRRTQRTWRDRTSVQPREREGGEGEGR